jgi:hypothetical protein
LWVTTFGFASDVPIAGSLRKLFKINDERKLAFGMDEMRERLTAILEDFQSQTATERDSETEFTELPNFPN